MKHSGTQNIETERLLLRRFESKDLMDMFCNWASNPKIQIEYGEPVYDSVEAVEHLLKQYMEKYEEPDYYRWAIIEKSTNTNIGQIAFCKVYSDCKTAEVEY